MMTNKNAVRLMLFEARIGAVEDLAMRNEAEAADASDWLLGLARGDTVTASARIQPGACSGGAMASDGEGRSNDP